MDEEIINTNTKICGILFLNKKAIHGVTKNGYHIREFVPANSIDSMYVFHVPTNKHFQANNVYAIIKYEKTENNIMFGSILEYIGNVGDLEVELKFLKCMATSHWSNLKKVNIDSYLNTDLSNNKRTIIENITILSIDPYGCEDIDDALHVCEHETHYEVGIHIADVSSYIEQNSEIDIELRQRVESIYLKHFIDKELKQLTINMLPKQLIEVCSLKKNKLSRAFSLIIELNKNDKTIMKATFMKTFVNVTHNMTYDQAQQQINKSNKKSTNNSLNLLYELGKSFYSNGDNTDPNYDVHKMVEVYMVIANEQSAKLIYENINLVSTCILRKHDKNNIFDNIIVSNNIDQDVFNKFKQITSCSADYVKVDHNSISNSNETHNFFHHGLNCALYTHFTSPIRRYVDIITHRLISQIIHNQYQSCNNDYITQELVEIINKYHKFYGHCERALDNLIKIYNIIDTGQEYIETVGNIISLSVSTILIYIKEYDLCIRTKLVSNQIKHLFSIEEDSNLGILTIEPNNKIELNSKKITLHLFESVQVMIAFTIKKASKIKLQIIEPDLRELYCNDLDEFCL
jgi:exosome complex exonuclease DIS3/RRP44